MKVSSSLYLCFRAFVSVLFLLASFVSTSKASALNDYAVNIFSDSAEMVLHLSYPINYQSLKTEIGRELHFKNAINLSDLSLANKRLSFWVNEISASYDVLIFRLKPNVVTDISAEGSDVRIVFRVQKEMAKESNKQASVAQDKKMNLALERINARLLFESGRYDDARDRYTSLLNLQPENTQIMSGLAGVEERLHNWRNALRLYLDIEELKPYSLSTIEAKQNLLRAYGSRITSSINYQKIGSDNTQVKLGLHGRQLMGNEQVLFVDYFLWDVVNDVATRNEEGELRTFDGQQHDLSLGVESVLFSGEQKVSFFAGKKQPGLAWAYRQAGDYGLLGLNIDWRVPWLETSESIADYGYRDRLAFRYEDTFFKNLNVYSTISITNYGLGEKSHVAESFRLQLAGYYNLQALAPGFSVGYSLDSENVYSRTVKNDSSGDAFVVFPLDDRELHVFFLAWENTFYKRYIFQSTIGYEHDRLRSAGSPFVELRLNYRVSPKFEIKSNIESGLSTYNEGSDDFLTLGASLNWYF